MSAVPNNQQCVWPGRSGTQYRYYVYALPVSFVADNEGNYIYSRLHGGFWIPIYVGEGNLSDRVGPSHHRAECIRSKGATHVHVHVNADPNARSREESDILANFVQAYSPVGCNVRKGG